MPAAFNPDAPKSPDQSNGPGPMPSASRFNDLDSRLRQPPVGASVIEALAEHKRGRFTDEDLDQLAFGMGKQVVKGKDMLALVARISDLEKQVSELTTRAVNAETAFASAKQELDAAKPQNTNPSRKERA